MYLCGTRRLLHGLIYALDPPFQLSNSIANLDKDLISDAQDGFSVVKKWAVEALDGNKDKFLEHSRLRADLENGWEEHLHPRGLRGVVMKATSIFEILLDGRRPAGWDGITLYRAGTDAYVPWHYY
jgi:hypothetical protein